MDDELLRNLAIEVARQLKQLREAIRREYRDELASVQRSQADAMDVLRTESAELAHRQGLSEQAIVVLRASGTDPIAGLVLDGDSTLHLFQRSGDALAVRFPNFEQLVAAGVDARVAVARAELEDRFVTAIEALVTERVEAFINAPVWDATKVYTEGEIVQSYVGRTYRVRAGVKASIAQEPGDSPEQWERLGSGGIRVLKSRPATLEAGDWFADNDSRFVHDGRTTALLVTKPIKSSDVERSIKNVLDRLQSVEAVMRGLITSGDASVREAVREEVQRVRDDAAQAWEQAIQALALIDELQRRLDDGKDGS